MNNYVESFLNNLASKENSQLTTKNYRIDLKKFYEYIMNEKNIKNINDEKIFLNEITLLDLESFRSHLRTTGGRSKSGEAANTINRRITSLKSYFKYLKKHGIILSNICEELEFVKGGKKNTIYLKKDEANELLASSLLGSNNFRKAEFASKRNSLIMNIYIKFGLRNSELINLKDSDFDCRNNELRVHGKGNKERKVFLSDADIILYHEYVTIREEQVSVKDDNTFLSNNGKKLDIVNIGRIVKKCLDGTSISEDKKSKITPHKLRHTAATIAMKDGVPLEVVSKLLGHEDPSVTSRVYIHIDDEDVKKACQKISSNYS